MSSVKLCRFVQIVTSDSRHSISLSFRVSQRALQSNLQAIRATSLLDPAFQASPGSYAPQVHASYLCPPLKRWSTRWGSFSLTTLQWIGMARPDKIVHLTSVVLTSKWQVTIPEEMRKEVPSLAMGQRLRW